MARRFAPSSLTRVALSYGLGLRAMVYMLVFKEQWGTERRLHYLLTRKLRRRTLSLNLQSLELSTTPEAPVSK